MKNRVYNYLLLDWDGCLAASLQNALDAYKIVAGINKRMATVQLYDGVKETLEILK